MQLLGFHSSYFYHVFSFVLGAIVGSFLNVVILRLPVNKSIIRPRSQCLSCHKAIRWYDNIPIISFLILKGKCRSCRSAISVRYPIVELLTACLFLAVQMQLGWSLETLFRAWPFVAILVAVTFIDLDHRIIPDQLSLGGLLWGLLTCFLATDLSPVGVVVGAAVGFSTFYAVAWIYEKWKNQSGIGGGDIKFLAMLGAFVGTKGVLTTVLISSVFGSLVGLGWAIATREKNMMKFALPFGPFLAIGALYSYLLGGTLWFLFTTQM